METRPCHHFAASVPALLLLITALASGLCQAAVTAIAKPAQWEPEIKTFEALDRVRRPPTNAVLFVGSSSIRMWKTLAEDMKGLPVINRGFGGSQMSDLVSFANRIVIPYQPREIVVYEGDNDIASGKTPEQVRDDFVEFVKKVHTALPRARITYLTIKPSPSRWKLAEKMQAANTLIAQATTADRRLEFIDVFTPLLGNDGQPRREFYLPDMLHLNQLGYQVWTTVIRARLTQRPPDDGRKP
jgi:lysophospholipase L1-like esterase